MIAIGGVPSLPLLGAPTNDTADVGSWPKADIKWLPANVRFRG